MNIEIVTQISIVFIFLSTLFASPLKTLISSPEKWSVMEKRKLSEFPDIELIISNPGGFLVEFENYYNDNFGYREEYIKEYSRKMEKMFQKSSVSKVMFGDDGWLYYSEKKIINDIQGEDYFSEEELLDWRKSLELKHDWFRERGIQYIYIVAPNKASIYPEYMPKYLRDTKKETRVDQLITYLNKKSKYSVMDLRYSLLEAKSKEQVYYKTDTHWNYVGMYAAYYQILSNMKKTFPHLVPLEKNNLYYEDFYLQDGGLTVMLGKTDFKGEKAKKISINNTCVKKTSIDINVSNKNGAKEYILSTECVGKSLKAVVFRDSFYTLLLPFMAEHFGEGIYIRDYYDHSIIEKVMQKFKPDIVIEEVVERNLKNRSIKRVISQLTQ